LFSGAQPGVVVRPPLWRLRSAHTSVDPEGAASHRGKAPAANAAKRRRQGGNAPEAGPGQPPVNPGQTPVKPNRAAQIEGDGLRAVRLSLDDLRSRFRHATVTATIECAGNRRAEMKALPSPGGGGHGIKGLDWDAGAIGTAVWGGVRLRDVLLEAGGWTGGVLGGPRPFQSRRAGGCARRFAGLCTSGFGTRPVPSRAPFLCKQGKIVNGAGARGRHPKASTAPCITGVRPRLRARKNAPETPPSPPPRRRAVP
jgi:hypothetical protein